MGDLKFSQQYWWKFRSSRINCRVNWWLQTFRRSLLPLHLHKSNESSWTDLNNHENPFNYMQDKQTIPFQWNASIDKARKNYRYTSFALCESSGITCNLQMSRPRDSTGRVILNRLMSKKVGTLFRNLPTHSFGTLYTQFVFIWAYNYAESRMY